MKLRDLYPSKYLKADDIEEEGGELRALIKGVKIEELQDSEGGKQDKPILYFLRIDKGLVMNKTNAETIGDSYGDDTDAWTGKEVLLVTERVTAFGKTAPAIRIRIPKKAAAPAPAAEPVAAGTPAEDTPF